MKRVWGFLWVISCVLLVGASQALAGAPPTGIPEPSTFLLLGVGAAGLAGWRMLTNRKK